MTVKTPITLTEAIREYGKSNQIMMAIEEMAELTKALCNERRNRPHNIAEEIADVYIMIHQLVEIYGCGTEVQDWIDRKMERLDARMKNTESVTTSAGEPVEVEKDVRGIRVKSLPEVREKGYRDAIRDAVRLLDEFLHCGWESYPREILWRLRERIEGLEG